MISELSRAPLSKVCTVLSKYEVEYIIVGGTAVQYYGYHRPSSITISTPEIDADLDFWYKPTNENFQRLILALDELKIDTSGLKELVFDPKRTFLRVPHEGFHTDFLPEMKGLGPFRECKKNAKGLELDGTTVHILSLEDLILNKKAVNRAVDLSDAEELEKIRNNKRKKGRRL
jgi:predicted nucleotidyltransferase